MSPKSLRILNRQILHLGDIQLTYYLLEDNQVYLSQKEFNKYIGAHDKNGKPIVFINDFSIVFSSNEDEADIGLPMVNVVTLCAGKIEEIIKGDSDVNLLFKCLSLLTVLSEKGVTKLESDIKSAKIEEEIEPEKDVKFDDLLAGLMRVPPPKKGK